MKPPWSWPWVPFILLIVSVSAFFILHEPARTIPRDPGTVYGFVRKYLNGHGMKFEVGIIAEARTFEERLAPSRYMKDTVSGRDGYYEFKGVPPGRYSVAIHDPRGAQRDLLMTPDRFDVTVGTSAPLRQDFFAYRAGCITGRFYWEDGSLIQLTNEDVSEYLTNKKPGSGYATVSRFAADGEEKYEFREDVSYRSSYRLCKLNPRYPAEIQAGLDQSVGDYFVGMAKYRSNIPVSAGETIKDVDFIFPRLKSPEDRLSINGRIRFPKGLKPQYGSVKERSWASAHRKNPPGGTSFQSRIATDSFRLHGLSEGDYILEVTAGNMSYEGSIKVPPTGRQPVSIDVVVDRETFERILDEKVRLKAKPKKLND